MRGALSAALAALAVSAGAGNLPPGECRDRWVYVSRDFRTDASLASFSNTVSAAAANGMNGVLLAFDADYCHRFKPDRLARLARAKEIADACGVEIVPLVCNVGYGAPQYSNVNLLESEEIRDLRYVARKGGARFVPEGGNRLQPDAWKMDLPDKIVFRDPDVSHSGAASFRFEPKNDPRSGNAAIRNSQARIWQDNLPVSPGKRYRLSAWVKTEGLENPDGLKLQVYDAGGKSPFYADAWTGEVYSGARADSRWDKAAGDMDWRRICLDFTAGATNRITAYIGSWRSKAGRFWVDGAELVEIGHRSVVTNGGCRVTVRNAKTGRVYEEGRDFLPLGLYGKGERAWRILPDEPELPIPEGSAIEPGDELLVSAYTPVVIDTRQWVSCMSHPGLYEFFREGLTAVRDALHPRKWFLTLDEIRAGGSCGLCKASGKDQAHILGECVTKLRGIVKELCPEAEIYAWHDMFDPKHNAVEDYCQARTTYRGSWKFIPKDVIICVWGSARRAGSLKFFAKEGFRTVGACFYDIDRKADLRTWADMCRATDGCRGLVYTSWKDDFSLLPAFNEILSE